MTRRARLIASLVLAPLAASVACHDPDKYQVLSPTNVNGIPAEELLDLTAAATSIRADGGSRTRIEAHINPSATARTITFTTTHGTLYAGASSATASTGSLRVDADVTGIAAVELQSDTQPATSRVTASITIPGSNPAQTIVRAIDIQFTAVSSGEVIAVSATPSTADADGSTRIRLVATIMTTLPPNGRDVTFTATAGQFASNTVTGDSKMAKVPADSSNTAVVELIAPTDPGRVGVTATASNFSARTDITFNRAGPDVIFVELDKSSIARVGTASAKVTVSLLRDVGAVSTNTPVTFTATDFAGVTIGTFSQITLAKPDSNDHNTVKATAVFDPDDVAAAGVATITATVGSKSGSVPITLN